MMKCLPSCSALVLAAATALAQVPSAPAPAAPPAAPAAAETPEPPVPKEPVEPLLRKPPSGVKEQILEFGSFELPRVKERSAKAKGGNFLLFTSDEWVRFKGDPNGVEGTLSVGMTNEVAHTGRQSMYVEFNKLKRQRAEGELSSQLIPIHPTKPYHVSIWGRMDKKRPIAIDQRIPALGLQVDFFEEDGETQTGDQVFRIQPMPGSRDRPPFFVTGSWREYYADLETPAEARFLKITWRFTTPPSAGEINGIMYFDDATLFGEKVEEPEVPEEPDPANPAPATPGAPAPAGAPPAATPAPAAAPAAEVPAAPKPRPSTTPRPDRSKK